MSLSVFWILVGMIHVYFLIVIYSVIELLEYEGQQRDCHEASAMQGYSQELKPKVNIHENESYGYQTAEFQGE